MRTGGGMSLSNADISELLARAGESAEGHRRKAYQRAAAYALMWAEEASDVLAREETLTGLPGIGDSLSRRISGWLQEAPDELEPPPARSGFVTYKRAREMAGEQPEWGRALRADLQMHTHYSDGVASIKEMALGAATRGYEFIAVTDHSQGLAVAGGMDEARLGAQAREVATVNEELQSEGVEFDVLHGIELNLDEHGDGDMDPNSIADLDLVLGSFHSRLRGAEDQTDRYLGALANPHVQVIGHPTCRRYNKRPGLVADWSKIFAAAETTGKALEINAHPHRQDLSPKLLAEARDFDITFSIGTDAHSVEELQFVEMSLAGAQRAGIERDRIINYWPLERVREWIAVRRESAT
jgi:histidinol phosphatase-like PHP family hydrolase